MTTEGGISEDYTMSNHTVSDRRRNVPPNSPENDEASTMSVDSRRAFESGFSDAWKSASGTQREVPIATGVSNTALHTSSFTHIVRKLSVLPVWTRVYLTHNSFTTKIIRFVMAITPGYSPLHHGYQPIASQSSSVMLSFHTTHTI